MNLSNLLTPSVLFFSLGLLAQLIRSDLKLPSELTKSITIYLLISIGLHGGRELAHSHFSEAIPSISVAFFLGFSLPLFAYMMIRKLGKVDSFNAVAIATHYGSVSAGTFLTALAFLEIHKISFESYPIIMLAIMETPAILIGLLMVFWIRTRTNSRESMDSHGMKSILREAFTNGSILLLLGGMLIGYSGTDKSMLNIQPFFDQLFYGVLCIFLLAMGMEAGKKLSDFKQAGLFLIFFGIAMPIIGGVIGVSLGTMLLHFSIGGATLVGVLAASASYIAVPPVMRMAVPEANPSIYLTLSLGVTFPFNVVIGIPLYYHFAQALA
jgi:hypothetical protein